VRKAVSPTGATAEDTIERLKAVLSREPGDWVECAACGQTLPLHHYSVKQLAEDTSTCYDSSKTTPELVPLADLRQAAAHKRNKPGMEDELLTRDNEIARAYMQATLFEAPSIAVEMAQKLCDEGISFCWHDIVWNGELLESVPAEVTSAYNKVIMKDGRVPDPHKKLRGFLTPWQTVAALVCDNDSDWEEMNIYVSTIEKMCNALMDAGIDPKNEIFDDGSYASRNVHYVPQCLIEKANIFNDNVEKAVALGEKLGVAPPSKDRRLIPSLSAVPKPVLFMMVIMFFLTMAQGMGLNRLK